MSLKDMIQNQEQNTQVAQNALADAMNKAQNTDSTNGTGNENTGGTGGSGASSSSTPIVYSQVELERRVSRITDDEKDRRRKNSESEVLKAVAKSPSSYALAEKEYGRTQKFEVKEAIVKMVPNLEEGASFPLAFPKEMRYTIDGYQVRLMENGQLKAEPEIISKAKLGKWIRENALMRIGNDDRGVRIKERSTLTNSAYLVAHWGFNLKDGSEDVLESFEYDGDEKKGRSLNLNTGDVKYNDANSNPVKIQALVQLPVLKRKGGDFENNLGPLTTRNTGKIRTQYDVDTALLALAKIDIAEDKLKAMHQD